MFGGDYAFDAAAALGVLGEKAASAAPALRRAIREPGADSLYAFPLARIDRQNAKAILRPELKTLGSEWGSRGHLIMLSYLADTVIDREMQLTLMGMLDDPDPEVTRGAAWVLMIVGMPTGEVGERLMRMMKDGGVMGYSGK